MTMKKERKQLRKKLTQKRVKAQQAQLETQVRAVYAVLVLFLVAMFLQLFY